ncbi:MAG: glycoside hydrolase family 88 protein [Alistipes sp.]|uniref:glycoside hydrolase family 88/105 protein n=1 Tax=Alistipes sp. TaxID=1872444 RepID=UPI001D370C43|nr:glycoside hydrolase family 88 protein [Alistipes sp.]MBS5019936.1 glycoside hydrolase family 88 protein [Alistipes sp.]
MYKRLITSLLLWAAILGAPAAAEAGKRDRQIANRVAQWQIDNFGNYFSKGLPRSDQHWANGALYRGMVVWGETSGYKPCEEFVLTVGRRNGWRMGRRQYHADDICVGQAYLMLYQRHGDTAMLRPVLQRADSVIAFPAKTRLHIKARDGSKRWSWCDALFMAPPVYALLTRITGDQKYLQFMNSEFYAATAALYDPAERLYYRDARYIPKREKNGKKVFWSRGNGWCYAALAILLDTVPESDPTYDYYRRLFVEMSASVVACQDRSGSWHPSMLDPEAYPMPENSASGFFTYGLAWGVNRGLLTGSVYRKAARRGWKALCSHVDSDGRLGYVQPIGGSPASTTREMTEVYGVGAFLLAASEIVNM